MLRPLQRDKLRTAFVEGSLRVQSVSPEGALEWKHVLHVNRAEVGDESILKVTTTKGFSVLTGGHRVFTTPTTKVEAEKLEPSNAVVGVSQVMVSLVERLPARQYMYDLTASDWHNFVLYRSGMCVSNSPDRNYHFRPPTSEETVHQYNRVFGYIWESEEMREYLYRSMDDIISYPPRTPFASVDELSTIRPEWRSMLLVGAERYALHAVRTNWIADEFTYSIGGVSLDLDQASKYEGAYSAATEQFDKQIEHAKATVNYVRGLQQPKYGTGIRSSFGPYSGRGVLSPRKFTGV